MDDLEDVSVEMERVLANIPVKDGDFDVGHVIENDGVGHGTVGDRVQGVVAHGEGSQHRRNQGRGVGDVVERGTVVTIVVRREEDVHIVRDRGKFHGHGDDGYSLHVIEDIGVVAGLVTSHGRDWCQGVGGIILNNSSSV